MDHRCGPLWPFVENEWQTFWRILEDLDDKGQPIIICLLKERMMIIYWKESKICLEGDSTKKRYCEKPFHELPRDHGCPYRIVHVHFLIRILWDKILKFTEQLVVEFEAELVRHTKKILRTNLRRGFLRSHRRKAPSYAADLPSVKPMDSKNWSSNQPDHRPCST